MAFTSSMPAMSLVSALCIDSELRCSTPDIAGGLILLWFQEESCELLQQTADATEAQLQLEGVFDLQPIVRAAVSDRLLDPRHLNALASTLDAAESLLQQLGMTAVERDRQNEASTSTSADPGDPLLLVAP